MQNIIVDKPYRFLPPLHSDWGPWFVQTFRVVDKYLNKAEGIESHEVRGAEALQASLRAGHSIVLAPNHCRYADPIAIGWLARVVDVYLYSMASWHLFNQSRLQALAIRACGGFSVYREGVDRQSLNTAVDILTAARRPLVVFPEGTVFRTNDRLQPLLDGVSFLTRMAAKRRAKQDGGRVVVHPIAIKYLFKGDVAQAVEPVLAEIEERFTLRDPGRPAHLLNRIARVSEAMQSLKEILYLGAPQSGSLACRQGQLTEHLLVPLEQRWLGRKTTGSIMTRVKQLRAAIVPGLFEPHATSAAKAELWAQLTDVYMAQQIASRPSDYLDEATDTRVLETVEGMEEDLTDRARTQRPLHAILQVGEAIEVSSDKPTRDSEDPLMSQLAESLRGMLSQLAKEARPIPK